MIKSSNFHEFRRCQNFNKEIQLRCVNYHFFKPIYKEILKIVFSKTYIQSMGKKVCTLKIKIMMRITTFSRLHLFCSLNKDWAVMKGKVRYITRSIKQNLTNMYNICFVRRLKLFSLVFFRQAIRHGTTVLTDCNNVHITSPLVHRCICCSWVTSINLASGDCRCVRMGW